MKKILLLAISFFALTSCTKEEDSQTAASLDTFVLLHSMVTTVNDTTHFTTTYSYSGNELTRITQDNGDYDNYTYIDGNISEINTFSLGHVILKKAFSYNSNNLISQYLSTNPTDSTAQKEVYTYPGDGNITFVATKGDLLTQTIPDHTGKVFFTNDEVSMIQAVYPTGVRVRTYTYDLKKNPLKNVTGFSKISFVNSQAGGIFHNILTSIYTVPSTPTVSKRTDFTYNTAFYPATSTTFTNNVSNNDSTLYNY